MRSCRKYKLIILLLRITKSHIGTSEKRQFRTQGASSVTIKVTKRYVKCE